MSRMMGLFHDCLDSYNGYGKRTTRIGKKIQRQVEKRELAKEIISATPPRLEDDHWGYYYEGLLCGVCGALDDDKCTLEC